MLWGRKVEEGYGYWLFQAGGGRGASVSRSASETESTSSRLMALRSGYTGGPADTTQMTNSVELNISLLLVTSSCQELFLGHL